MSINFILDRAEKQLSNTCIDFNPNDQKINSKSFINDIKLFQDTKAKYSEYKESEYNNFLVNEILIASDGQYDKNYYCNNNREEIIESPKKSSIKIEMIIRSMIEKELNPFINGAKNEVRSIIENLTNSIGDFNYLKGEFLSTKDLISESKIEIDSYQKETSKLISNINIHNNSVLRQIEAVNTELKKNIRTTAKFELENVKINEKIQELSNSNGSLNKNKNQEDLKILINDIESKYSSKIKLLENNMELILNEVSTYNQVFTKETDFKEQRKKSKSETVELYKIINGINLDIKKIKLEIESKKQSIDELNNNFSLISSFLESYKSSQDEEKQKEGYYSKLKIDIDDIYNKLRQENSQIKLNLSNQIASIDKETKALNEEFIVFRSFANKKDCDLENQINESLTKINNLDYDNKTISEILNKLYEELEDYKSNNENFKEKISKFNENQSESLISRTEELAKSIRILDNYRIENYRKIQDNAKNNHTKILSKIDNYIDNIHEMKASITKYKDDKDLMTEILIKLKEEIDYIKNTQLYVKEGKEKKEVKENNKIIKQMDAEEIDKLVDVKLDFLKNRISAFENDLKHIKLNIEGLEAKIKTSNTFSKRPLDPYEKEKLLVSEKDDHLGNSGKKFNLAPINPKKSPRKLNNANKMTYDNWDEEVDEINE